ncbi:ABC1 family-domain-containing protein [Ochromonadaceae sp. CCMP2298]|nr:ABC1 family-domain-containing protein [Ochromonadaceae sp. CCMP2298]
MFRLKSFAKLGGGALSLGAAGAGGGWTFGDEGTKRSLLFWSQIFPVYLHYRCYQLLNRDLGIMSEEYADQQYLKLHEKYSPRVKHIVYSMRGFYLKNAQVMSTQDDFVPAAYMHWVKDTQDNVPSEFVGAGAREFAALQMQEEQGLAFDEVFSSWDDKPLGVASIGEVHSAVLRSTGQRVAVKLLCPGIEERFRADIKTLRSFCKLAMPQHVSAFDEIEKQFCTEFDYTAEAGNLSLVRNAVMPKWGRLVSIPEPLHQYTSKHVLVMQFLDGVKLVDGMRAQYRVLAEQRGTTLEAMEEEQAAAVRAGTFQFKSIAESKAERSRQQWLCALNDFVLTPSNWGIMGWNCSAGLLLGWAPLKRTSLPMELGSVLELLCQVHGNEIFEHGTFNGDPHPGNILLLTDGRLGLIDYGQVKTMSLQERTIYAKLIVAHARGDRAEVVRVHFEEQGVRTRYNNPDVAYLFSAFYNDRSTEDVCGGRNISSFIDHLQELDPMEQLPEAYIFASRVSFMMRGMAKAFGLNLRMGEMWEQEAQAFLKAQGIDY